MEAEQHANRVARSDATSATRDMLLEGQLGALDAAISRLVSLGALESGVSGPSPRWPRVRVSGGAAVDARPRPLEARPRGLLRAFGFMLREGEGGGGRAR